MIKVLAWLEEHDVVTIVSELAEVENESFPTPTPIPETFPLHLCSLTKILLGKQVSSFPFCQGHFLYLF